jgi:tRNA-2-methylthio-N6-dimethylallyladenosine synthase
MEDQIPPEIMDDRLQRLQARIAANQLAFNRSSVGRETQVLIERPGKHPGQMIGRSPWLQSVHVETDAVPGDMLDVTLVSAGPNSMTGIVVPTKGGISGQEVADDPAGTPAHAGVTRSAA